jgi:hypothetical protein
MSEPRRILRPDEVQLVIRPPPPPASSYDWWKPRTDGGTLTRKNLFALAGLEEGPG